MFFLAVIIFLCAACGTGQDKVVSINLQLPVDWESAIDMGALGATSSTPYIGTIRFLYGGAQVQYEDFPYAGHSASFNADGTDNITVQALTAGQVIMEGSVSGVGSTVSLQKANGFSDAGTLLYTRQNHSAVFANGIIYVLGGNTGTGTIEAVASSVEGFISSAYAASLAYTRGEATVLHDEVGNQLFVFKGASAVEDNLYEVVDLGNEIVVPKSLASFRTDYFPILNDKEIILVGGFDTVVKDSWQVNSYELDMAQIPFTESILPFISLDSERQDVMCSVNNVRMICLGGYANSSYVDELKVFDLLTKSAMGGTYLPVGRIKSALANIDNQSMVVVGGLGQTGYLSDINVIDLINLKLTVFEDALHFPRANHTATLINTNEVLIVGGGPTAEASRSAELLDLTTGESTLLPWTMKVSRVGHTATLLPDGRVLVAGGNATDRRMEVFNPYSGL
ncbi:MAG: kelch repeat-containing protein [bacterium]|nr:kelch repeat-containing protein [bacterium]